MQAIPSFNLKLHGQMGVIMADKKEKITTTSLEDSKEIPQNGVSKVSEKKVKDFIPNAVNPDNGAAFEVYSNPLSSKGN